MPSAGPQQEVVDRRLLTELIGRDPAGGLYLTKKGRASTLRTSEQVIEGQRDRHVPETPMMYVKSFAGSNVVLEMKGNRKIDPDVADTV
jgi:hypothetical protein